MNHNEQHNHKPNPYTNKNPFQKTWTEKREFKAPQTPYVKSPNSSEQSLANENQQTPESRNQSSQNPYVRKIEPTKQTSPSSPISPLPGEILISPEQKALLLYLLQMKFMTMDQIDRKFFKSQSMAQNFRSLLAHGFLKTKSEELSSESLIVPTEKAYEILKLENPEKEVPQALKRVFEPAVNHDLKLVELRMRFEELNFIKKWHSEKSLAEVPLMNRLFQDLPDAICKKPNDKGYFLELEISKKSPKVYEERIAHYIKVLESREMQEQGIEGVIFLCAKEEVCKIIKDKIPKSKAFSVLMLDRYLKAREPAA
jgi:hypothetical protein